MQELFGGRRCTCRRIACRCQSTLAADVAAHEVFPPARPQERTAKPQGGWVGETCPSGGARAARVLWQGQAITLALRTLAATCHCGRSCACPKRWLAARVALLLEVGWLPKHIGRQCGSSGGIPTRPPPRAEPSCRAGGWERLAPRVLRWRPGYVGADGRNSGAHNPGRHGALAGLEFGCW